MRAKKLVPAAVPFEGVLDKHLKNANQKEVMAYLNACLGDGDEGDMEAFFRGLHDIARAKNLSALAEKTNVKRDTYYKIFASQNPTLATFRSLLKGLDMDFEIVSLKK